jgi:hypothetical protein
LRSLAAISMQRRAVQLGGMMARLEREAIEFLTQRTT